MKTEELIELLKSCSEKNCPVCPDSESCTGPSWLLRKAAEELMAGVGFTDTSVSYKDCRGVPVSMYEIMSMHEGYDDITFAAMELILENGPDALMYQLNYDDIDRVKEFPTIYQRAIELGILTGEE